MKAKVEAKNIFKIFGDDPKSAQNMLEEGRSKEEIFEATGLTIGVQDASFAVQQGEIFVIMGLSGSGKSTLVRMINGLIAPTSGEMLVDGTDIANCSPQQMREIRRTKVAMVFQHFALFPHKTVGENAAYGLKIKGMGAAERRERALAALEQVGLRAHADSYPDELSGGMQQRVGLARGLAAEPEVLLMDEPFSALDPLIRSDMQEELLELQRSMKKTIIFITHDLDEALTLGDRIAIMHNGAIVQIGTAEEIVDKPADDYVAAFTKDIDRSRVFTAQSVLSPAEAIDLSKDTAASAIERMEQLNRDAIYVLDGDRIAGTVTYRDLTASMRDNGAALSDAIIADYPTTKSTTPLHELYPLCESGLPIAIVGRKGRLEGIVEPQAVLAKVASDSDEAA
ncbi:quaternary amine ABC transporter ATP-binding protein [Mesorhizobium xinjiangense]|uniref:quaternary amine ABC transporter ATP-binding protein n=1 Tax=Mesorhizobium xinjiangense TaxID=2678685 RepID=UPI0012EE78C6|nr:glycine betaine/L-proline ABC transporter ATP-binding protein [Mesorhizobium xinjiangense]